MSSKGTKPRTKKDQAPEDQQREMDLQEIKKRTSSVAKEAEELLTGAANLAELPPVNDVEETAVQVPDSFLSLLDASHAANRKKLSTEQPKKGAKVTLEVERKTSDSSLGVAEKSGSTGGTIPKASRRGSGSASAEQSADAKAASAHLANLMSNSQSVVEGFDTYVGRVVQAGMRLHDKDAAKVWRDCEPVVKDLTSRHSYKVSKILVSIMPCSVGEFYNRVMGLSEGASLGVSDNLKKVEESLGLMVDNLQMRCHEMDKNQLYHDTQMTSLATQVGNASASFAQ